MRRAYLCDFDGTIAPADIGAAFVRQFSRGREAEGRALLERWRAGELGHRELTEAECRLIRVSQTEALEFTRQFSIDPHFGSFARGALAGGDAVMVLSEGFDFYVSDQLERAGLGALPWASNHARFEDGAVIPEFPHPNPQCDDCGNCKAWHVRRYQELGCSTVLVGNGLSDRCGARAANVVLARDTLLDWCRDEGLPAVPFADFAEVAAWMRQVPPTPAISRS